MTSSATQDFLRDIVQREVIPEDKLAYIAARLCNLFHQAMLIELGKAEKKGLTRGKLAKRIGKKPEQITRWLSYPGNLTFETFAKILVGMGVEVDGLVLTSLASATRVQFPQYEKAPVSEEMPTPIKVNDLSPHFVPPKSVGRTEIGDTKLMSDIIVATPMPVPIPPSQWPN